MTRAPIEELQTFLAVARERSFTRAAAQLGVSPSALSHSVRGLETRLGVRLLNRSTRSVAPTEAGEHLARAVGPHFEGIEVELAALGALRDRPAGTLRITATEYVTEAILWPKVAKFLRDYPNVRVEIAIDYALTDIVAERFDAGCATAAWSRRTWLPCASAPISAWRWWARLPISRAGRCPKSRRT